ncbi:hypothetical protein ACFX5U_14560 [Sphingobacterium sp. SG20118]|uniref:hypothetical protein n=1 Tax=Sphingobacterium sp. SG20118 TaxID=3367156 RepID=UPI0037DFC284
MEKWSQFLNGAQGTSTLSDKNQLGGYTDRFLSYYANGGYTYKDRYIINTSFRKDASNLFGVKSNDRGQPFWSVGGAWILTKEDFLRNSVFDFLKLRVTYGYNGNVNTSKSAFPIIEVQSDLQPITNQNYAFMMSPPNADLRWERVGTLNLGLDFSIKGGRLSGSIEHYRKKPKDLIILTNVDPTTGYSTLMVNGGNLDIKGWDISLNTKPLKFDDFEWSNNVVFSYNRSIVVQSSVEDQRGVSKISSSNYMMMTPVAGMDLFSQLTFKWAGLDPQTGEPQGYVNGEVSKDYIAIYNSKTSDLENHGSLMPLYFGSFRNNFQYKSWELSCNISYQLGHVFLRNTFTNDNFIANKIGHADYSKRWQKPGDELITDVPAFTYPNNYYGSRFYMMSSALVEPADQIKLRDIQFSYTFPMRKNTKFKNLRLYAYFQNIGTVWRANKLGIDPEYGNSLPDPLSSSLGLSFNL